MAGRSSTISSSIRERDTSLSRCCPSRSSVSTAFRAARSPIWVKPATTDELERAFDKLRSYVRQPTKRLLIIEDNRTERESIVELLGHDDIEIAAVGTGNQALEALRARRYDCCVLDLRLPDMSGFELLDRPWAEPELRDIPVVVFTGMELSTEEEAQLRTIAKSVVVKDVQSPERLLDETALFLHRVVPALPEGKQKMIERLHDSPETLRGRKVLVVDDDARNIFALTTILENQEMDVLSVTNGRQAIEIIETTPDLTVVLMDIMMPEMDGYETMRRIRKDDAVPRATDPRPHRQGDEGRPREVPAGWRLRLHRQASEHGAAPLFASRLALPLGPPYEGRDPYSPRR